MQTPLPALLSLLLFFVTAATVQLEKTKYKNKIMVDVFKCSCMFLLD